MHAFWRLWLAAHGCCDVPWQILHIVGDRRFAEYLASLSSSARLRVWPQLLCTAEADAEFERYFARHFPQTKSI